MKNSYTIAGEVTYIHLHSPKYGSMDTLISTAQLEKAKEFINKWIPKWNESAKGFYVYGKTSEENKPREYLLHRWITGAAKGYEVDHINHNTLDNTDMNLRIVTVSENQQNRKGNPSNNSSGMKNVYWHKRSGSWEVQLRIKGKKITGGYYKKIEEAKIAAAELRSRHFDFENIGSCIGGSYE